ncbi:hypothetical protein [Streptomyces sp. NPDC050263]|uniref:hypothetical protein n=1 Tax=Streptomyces sp. NPDC050263 TaxID=3155037 RepID=UPI0034319EEF
MTDETRLRPDFLWGTSTAPAQVEGNNTNRPSNGTRSRVRPGWERSPAARGKGLEKRSA